MRSSLFAALLLFSYAAAQTLTVTDGDGDLVVEVITQDVDGDPTTSIVSTVFPAFTSTITATDAAGDVVLEQVVADGEGDTQTQTLRTLTTAGAAAGNTPFTSTITTTNAAQQTVIEQIIGDGAGDTNTVPIETLAAAGGAGPVGQPDPTTATAGAPTPYTYTTVIDGVTTAVLATFTPSVATGVAPSATFKATVLNYSQYLASYATAVQTQQASSNNNAAFSLSPSWLGVGLSLLTGVVGGAVLILGA